MRRRINKQLLYKPLKITPPQFLALIFIGLVSVGGMLLKLPIATNEPLSWVDAFFLSTSAATVTGLSPIDISSQLTMFGQAVLMLLIQVGGLGIMTFTVLVIIMLGKRIGMKQRLIMQEALNQPSLGGVIRLVRNVIIFSFITELVASALLMIRFIPEQGLWKGMFYSLFHTVASFNNAGFALYPNNLMNYVGDPLINLVITGLIILGGLGFTVVVDLYYQRQFAKLSLHSKVMLVGTLVVNVVVTLLIYLFEFKNPGTLGALTWDEKLWAAYFQAITPRTAGFNTVDIGALTDSTLLLMLFLMFVGAGSASTGGGIKLTTFLVIVVGVIAFLRGKEEPILWRRTIKVNVILKALAILSISVLFIFIAMMLLSFTEEAGAMKILFEVVSAFGTVGLSMNFTSELSSFGKVIIIFIMFLGKMGPLTLVFSISKPKAAPIKYPEGELFTG